MEQKKKIKEIDMTKLKAPILRELVDSGVITKQGIRISGMGMVIVKLEVLQKLVDKTNLKLHFIEKKIE